MPISPRSIRTLAAVSTAVLAVLALAFHLTTTQATHDPGAMAANSAGGVDEPLTGVIRGVVADTLGQQLEGAWVAAQGACSPCVTSTASDGSFAFLDLTPGQYTLYAIAFGHQPRFWTSSGGATERASAETIEVATGATAIADFKLSRYTTISGQVTDRNGIAVGDSLVSAYNLDSGATFNDETDPNGIYQISLHEAGDYRLQAEAFNYNYLPTFWTESGGVVDYLQAEAVPVPEALEQSLTGYDIALFRSSTISGRVTDNSGNPIGGATVAPHSRSGYCVICRFTETDANGEYTIPVEPGSYWVFVQAPYFREEWWNSSGGGTAEQVVVGLEEDVQLSGVQLARYGMITGTVRDSEGNPLQDALVSAEPTFCCAGGIAVTDENGEYTIMGLLPRDYVVNASLTGYRTAYWTPVGSVESPADAVAVTSQLDTVVSGIDLTLLPKGSIAGRLTDTDGNGIPGAGVVASANDFQCCEFWSAPADDDGYYRIVDLETGDYKLYGNAGSVYATGFYTSSGGTTEMAQAEAVHVEFGVDTPGVNFRLLRYGSVAGRVTDVQGNPIAAAEVRAYFPECSGCTPPSSLTDGEGYYRFEALEPRDYVLGAFAGGHVPQFWGSTGNVRRWEDATVLHPALEQVLTGIDFSLPRPASIRGRVLDSSGNPLEGATVSLTIVGCPGCGAGYQTNSDGEYSIPGFPPGQITLAAYKAGYYPPGGYTSTYWTSDGGSPWEPEVISVSDGAQLAGFDIILRHPGAVHGTVSDVHGDPLNGVKVELLSDDCSQCAWTYTSTTGHYLLIVPVGEYLVSASRSGFVTEFWTASGGTSNPAHGVSINVTEGATIDGIDFSLLPQACAPGDVTGDTRVNIRDITSVARAMGARPGKRNWNPDADVNGDGRIDVRDLRVVIEAFWSDDCR